MLAAGRRRYGEVRAARDPGAARRPARPARAGRAPTCSSAAPSRERRFTSAGSSRSRGRRRVRRLRPSSMSLVRKELIRAEPAILPGEEAFRFRHALIREAAYEGLAKEATVRAARALRRLARGDARRPCRGGRGVPRLPPRAGVRLPCRARRASTRRRSSSPSAPACGSPRPGGSRFAVATCGRRSICSSALARCPPRTSGAGLELAPDLGFALCYIGEFERAESVLGEAIDRARALSASALPSATPRWYTTSCACSSSQTESISPRCSVRPSSRSSILQEAEDDLALTRAWIVLWFAYQWHGQRGPASEHRRTGARACQTSRQPHSTRRGASRFSVTSLARRADAGPRRRASSGGASPRTEGRSPGRGDC